jgi:hypothetical protein
MFRGEKSNDFTWENVVLPPGDRTHLVLRLLSVTRVLWAPPLSSHHNPPLSHARLEPEENGRRTRGQWRPAGGIRGGDLVLPPVPRRRPGSRTPPLLPIRVRFSRQPLWFHISASPGSAASSDEGSDMAAPPSSSRDAVVLSLTFPAHQRRLRTQ